MIPTHTDTTGPSATLTQFPASSLSPSHFLLRFFFDAIDLSPPLPTHTRPSAVLAIMAPCSEKATEWTKGGESDTPLEGGRPARNHTNQLISPYANHFLPMSNLESTEP